MIKRGKNGGIVGAMRGKKEHPGIVCPSQSEVQEGERVCGERAGEREKRRREGGGDSGVRESSLPSVST